MRLWGNVYLLRLRTQRPAHVASKALLHRKGYGTRAWDHLLTIDDTPKGRRIREILDGGHQVMVTILCDKLEETQALRLEAEMIGAFGTEATGGLLTNSVVPSGDNLKPRRGVTIPMGAPEKAQLGLSILKDAVLELAQANPGGITNSDTCRALGLKSDYAGGSKDYLSWSVIGLLMREGRLRRINKGNRGYHIAQVR